MNRKKEVAKFFAGVSANQVLTHGAFAVSGVQFTLVGITYTRGLNVAAVAVWTSALIFLVYYAWMKK